jgi:hypothetical protein
MRAIIQIPVVNEHFDGYPSMILLPIDDYHAKRQIEMR